MIAACLKWVDRRPDVDALTGAVSTDARTSSASDADLAALEWALRLGELWGDEVVAVTAGPPPAEHVLREALAAGASHAVRCDIDRGAPSEEVAAALAACLAAPGVVCCGAWSLDRGSGSVPAFLAARLGAAQALGLIGLSPGPSGLQAERRLDGGRRERLRIPTPAVISVEGGSARLRRAPLDGVLRAAEARIEVIPRPPGHAPARPAAHTEPFRPRARVLDGPPATLTARERILSLTGALSDRVPPRTLFLPPDEAAAAIVGQLRTWGYLP
jgi:electron transfer flavoprotein beta subunit